MGQSGLPNEQMSLAGDEQGVAVRGRRVYGGAVPQPVDPGRRHAYRGQASQLRGVALLDLLRVRRRLELLLQICGDGIYEGIYQN